tara:strand:- start:266 stop:595 length:330 start_codon:yes stop_codon:yes gene_type:complete
MKKLKFDPENWDWYAFLEASEEIKQKFRVEAHKLSAKWVTCACGQVCNILPKALGYSFPLDDDVTLLGLDFTDLVINNDWNDAKKILDKIEERTIFLLKQPNFIDTKTL